MCVSVLCIYNSTYLFPVVLKVFCCSFAESFTMLQWIRVSTWVNALFMRKLSISLSLDQKKVSVGSMSSKREGGGGVRGRTSTGVDAAKMRASRLPSASGKGCHCIMTRQ